MGRNGKLYGHLEQLEDDFRSLLVRGLEEAKATGNGWVFEEPKAHFRIGNYFLNKTPKLQRLIDLAAEITNLRRKLGEPYEGSIVDVYQQYAGRHADWENKHRLGPKRMAEELLSRLRVKAEQTEDDTRYSPTR